MKKKDNFLDYVPVLSPGFEWRILENGHVELDELHKGFFFWLTQKLFKKPRVSRIEFEEIGSFVWQTIDGAKTVNEIAEEVRVKFGDKAEPLYERIIKYLGILYSHKFISYKKKK